jgi:hypothetical protein
MNISHAPLRLAPGLLLVIGCFLNTKAVAADVVPAGVSQSVVGQGWANNSVNVVIFRKNSLVTWKDTQYVAYYDADRHVVLGKRKIGTDKWTTLRTAYQGDADDAHKTISIMVDGAGYLHVAWDHHSNKLHYARSVQPGSLELGAEQPMVGRDENEVTYPEFYRMPNGDLLFFYRTGRSGQGDLAIDRYDLAKRHWQRLQDNLISGEGKRNAYWQAFLDHKGTLHISWVWRESPDVASNHDLAYARSRDGGVTWENSRGVKYKLPITAASAEYALHIPQKSELINQTSMSADRDGNPYIATYWRDQGSTVPQYHVVYRAADGWQVRALGFRHTPFSLSGAGTKHIPISRPQLLVSTTAATPSGLLIFRDEERGNKVSAVKITDFARGIWSVSDLTNTSVGAWEPTYDTELWKAKGILSLFVQDAIQVDGEGKASGHTAPVTVIDWKPGL